MVCLRSRPIYLELNYQNIQCFSNKYQKPVNPNETNYNSILIEMFLYDAVAIY